jgi:gluconate 2-dehydrogenase gamma chain
MSLDETARRDFLVGSLAGLSATMVAARWPAMAATIAVGQPTVFLTAAQAADVAAMAAQVFPTTDTPGANEARVIYFIDLALVSFAKDSQAVYTSGLADLQTRAAAMGAASFAALTSDQQIQVMTAIEKTPFFAAVRTHTITGMFAAPQHGGNYREAGWKMIGFDDSLNFQEPFGYYDRV